MSNTPKREVLFETLMYKVKESREAGSSLRHTVAERFHLSDAEAVAQKLADTEARLAGRRVYEVVEVRRTETVVSRAVSTDKALTVQTRRYIVVHRPDGFVVVDTATDLAGTPVRTDQEAQEHADRLNGIKIVIR